MEMDGRLFEAAQTGSVNTLHQLLLENPLILVDSALISPHQNPLHIATKAGQLAFVQEIIKHKADLVSQLNKDGFRPLDIASAMGHQEIVKEIITTGLDVCRLKGRDGRASLHYATIYERIAIIDELLIACRESIKDVTSLGETALHLAVKYHKIEAFTSLIKWLETLGLEELVNWGDKDGNTILHLAVSRKQLESVELLLNSGRISSMLELNAKNARGLTAKDLLDIVIEKPNDYRLKEILQSAGALGTQTPNHTVINNQINPEPSEPRFGDWIKYFQFQMGRDSPGDTRNAMLVVAALIATVTFQAGINPPSSFVLDKTPTSSTNIANAAPPQARDISDAGFVALADLFIFWNTLALNASLTTISYLTSGFPFRREVFISVFSMTFAYGCAMSNIKTGAVTKDILLGIALLLPFLLRLLPESVIKLWKWLKNN